MESLYKRKKLDFSAKECTTCTYTQNIFPTDTNGRMVPTPPVLIQNKHLKRSSSDSDMGEASPHYHYPHTVNHISDARERTYISDKGATKSPNKEKLWSGDMIISEPPLLIKSCSAEYSRPTESTHHRKDKVPQKCITPASMSEKYRHPIFATSEEYKGHKWDKHLKPYGIDHSQYMVSSRKNGGYLSPFCSKSMLNKNIYVDCGRSVEIVNGDHPDNYKMRTHDKSPYDEMHHETVYSMNRQHSVDGSLLSTTNYKSHSMITSRDRSPPDDVKGDHRKARQIINPGSLVNLRILEKHERYIVVYAEINGKRYEGCLSIQRKPASG